MPTCVWSGSDSANSYIPPGLVLRRMLADDFILEFGCESVNILKVKVETERVSAGHEPAFHRIGQMEVSTPAVGEHAVGIGLVGRRPSAGGSHKAEAIVKALGHVEIVAGQDGGDDAGWCGIGHRSTL
jgi:hypothetical protein